MIYIDKFCLSTTEANRSCSFFAILNRIASSCQPFTASTTSDIIFSAEDLHHNHPYGTETSHTRKIFNPYKIVKRRKPTHRTLFSICQNLFPTIYQCTSPSVWEDIRKTYENILVWSCILLPWIVIQVITKKQTSIVLEPFIIIAKSIAVRATE